MENLAFFIAAQSGVPVLATGEPGVSKTRTTEAFAKFCQIQYECLIGSQHDPVDITGLPRVADDGQSFRYVKPEWYYRLSQSPRGGLLHLDELFDCAPAVQAAMLQILGDGVPRTWIVATGNPIEQSTNGFSLSGPVLNRLCWIDWETPFASWKKGLLEGWDSINTTFPILPQNWSNYILLARQSVVDFLNRTPALAQHYPQEFESDPKPFPTLRSWTNAATLIAACWSVQAAVEIEDTLIQGVVGIGASVAYRQYRKSLDLPDPEVLLKDPTKYNPAKFRGDLAMTALSSVVAAVLRNNTQERWLSAWEIIDRQCDSAIDIAAAVCAPLHRNRPPGAAVNIPANVQKKLFAVVG